LFGNELELLMSKESHRSQNHGKGGMVYWSPDYPPDKPGLRLVAQYEEVSRLQLEAA
jgi:hypothetical protein